MSDTLYRRCTLEVAEGRYDEAVDALLGLGLGGWQERLPVLTFWLSDETYASDACAPAPCRSCAPSAGSTASARRAAGSASGASFTIRSPPAASPCARPGRRRCPARST